MEFICASVIAHAGLIPAYNKGVARSTSIYPPIHPFTRSVHDYGHYSSGQYSYSIRRSLQAAGSTASASQFLGYFSRQCSGPYRSTWCSGPTQRSMMWRVTVPPDWRTLRYRSYRHRVWGHETLCSSNEPPGGLRSTALPFFSYFAVTAFRMVLHVIDFRAQLVPRDLLREQHLSS